MDRCKHSRLNSGLGRFGAIAVGLACLTPPAVAQCDLEGQRARLNAIFAGAESIRLLSYRDGRTTSTGPNRTKSYEVVIDVFVPMIGSCRIYRADEIYPSAEPTTISYNRTYGQRATISAQGEASAEIQTRLNLLVAGMIGVNADARGEPGPAKTETRSTEYEVHPQMCYEQRVYTVEERNRVIASASHTTATFDWLITWPDGRQQKFTYTCEAAQADGRIESYSRTSTFEHSHIECCPLEESTCCACLANQ